MTYHYTLVGTGNNDDIYSETPNDEYLFRIATTVNQFFEEIDRKDGINL